MHAFTPQQLSGGQRYGNRTKIGNWQEELCLEDAKKKERKKSIRGDYDEKLRHCNKPVQQIQSKDGMLRYGLPLSLVHNETNGTLACDPFESACNESSEFVTSVCRYNVPMARNSFVLLPIGGAGSCCDDVGNKNHRQSEDDVVRWGESFQIACCPSLVESMGHINRRCDNGVTDGGTGVRKPLFLSSSRATLSCRQLVYMTDRASSYDTHWVAHIPAKSKNAGFSRFVKTGTPLLFGEPFVLQHCATRELLSADAKSAIITDFGSEYEVCACAKFSNGRVGILRDEFRGTKTGATNCRPEVFQHVWSAVILPSDSKEQTTAAASPCVEGIIAKIRYMLRQHGLLSFRVLSQHLLSAAAENGETRLKRDYAYWIFTESGLRLDDDQFQMLSRFCEQEGVSDDTVDVPLLLAALRGEIGDVREDLINKAYERFDSGVDEHILEAAWESLCENDALDANSRSVDFMALWNWTEEGVITKEGFLDFHADLSAAVQGDSAFVEIMKILWSRDT